MFADKIYSRIFAAYYSTRVLAYGVMVAQQFLVLFV